jgi:hypothetical protein
MKAYVRVLLGSPAAFSGADFTQKKLPVTHF